MDNKIKANLLAERPYILKVTLDQTTDDQPVYFANVLEVEGCFGQGTTQEEAIEDLKLAIVDFIESLLDDNMPVPEPSRLVRTSAKSASANTYIFKAKGQKLQAQEFHPAQANFVLEMRTV